MTEMTFTDAAPVKRVFSGGKQPKPNPFVDVVAHIALETNEDGDAIAKMFILTHDVSGYGDSKDIVATDINRVKRQLSQAGKNNDPKVTVRISTEDVSAEEQVKPGQPKTMIYRTKVTFWTVAPYASNKDSDASE